MIEIIQRIYNIAIFLIILVLVLGAIVGIGFLYYLKVRKNKRRVQKEIDYSTFDRKDAKDYIKIDDIKDDMIIVDNGFRFIGVIECQGLDFYDAHVLEQSNVVDGYFGFINTINKPISLRQYSEAVDMEYSLEMYQKAYEKVIDKLDKAVLRLNEMNKVLENELDMDQQKKLLYSTEIKKATNEINALQFRKYHLEDAISYINEYSGVSTTPLITSTYVFDWEYNPSAFSVDLTQEEILLRAKMELEAIANAKIHALLLTGVKAKRCTTYELIDMCRRHSQPISSERYRLRDVLGSAYFKDIVTSDSVDRMKSKARDTVNQEALDALKISIFASDGADNSRNVELPSEETEGDE